MKKKIAVDSRSFKDAACNGYITVYGGCVLQGKGAAAYLNGGRNAGAGGKGAAGKRKLRAGKGMAVDNIPAGYGNLVAGDLRAVCVKKGVSFSLRGDCISVDGRSQRGGYKRRRQHAGGKQRKKAGENGFKQFHFVSLPYYFLGQ